MGLAEVVNSLAACREVDIKARVRESCREERVIEPMTSESEIRVSGLSRLCPREEVFASILGIVRLQVIEPDLSVIFRTGNAIHEAVRDIPYIRDRLWGWWRCEGCGENIEEKSARPGKCLRCGGDRWRYREMEFRKNGLIGHPDGILFHDRKFWLLEIKSANEYNYGRAENGYMSDGYLDQINLYMKYFHVYRGIFVYWNKGGKTFDETLIFIPVQYDAARVRRAEEKAGMIRAGIRTKTPPPRECCPKRESARAKECMFREECFKQ